jgi:DNA-binding XRE family transcriptional regulator
MIRTEAEYNKAVEKLRDDLKALEQQKRRMQDLGLEGAELEQALHPLISFHDQLKEEVEHYERMKRGDLGVLHSLTHVGRWLIGIRIAMGLSQRQLADILQVSEAQVSRDEKNEYHGITVERAQRILQGLGVRFRAEIEEPLGHSDDVEYA